MQMMYVLGVSVQAKEFMSEIQKDFNSRKTR